MTWLQRYHVRHYIENSLWILPVLGMLAAMLSVRLLHRVELVLNWESRLDPDTARAVLGTIASSLFTFVVFVSSALLVAVQLASAQLTPRIIGLVFKDPVYRFALTLFVFTFTFSLGTLVRITTSVPWLTTQVAAYGCVLSLGVFLFMIDHVGKALRPSGALWAVARQGRQVIESVYPQSLADINAAVTLAAARVPDGKRAATIPSPKEGAVLAFDQAGLLALAREANCVIEMIPQVGDHVSAGDPLFRVCPEGKTVPASALCHSIAVGQERTLEQDATFPFRIMVDIASKALSPAINDPTTAVLALDKIHHLLRLVGHRQLDTGQVRDAAGQVRLIYRTPDWEDFVRLAVTEIRHFGGESIQVARRLRAMLEDLIQTLPELRAPLLRRELTLLQRSAERFFAEPEDRALAEVGDLQGVGGKHEDKKEE
ncbi:MAG TPA: DUF2254 domain-containing protein [Planctomycetaceae bacterium]|nr:DUF2254 domain-containing protein [Planctomycetaceae bacterium]